jgi:CubicO group peptidase (beta-lactamase class C family)
MRKLMAPFAITLLAWSAPPAAVDSGKAGMDSAHLARIGPRMQTFVDQGIVAGTVTYLQRHGSPAHIQAVGLQDIESKKPMRADSIFEVMSMTKPVTSVAIMMLAEEGRLSLLDPVEKFLPEFKGMWVIDARVPNRDTPGDRERSLKRPSRPITIRDLMTHTSGLPEYGPEATADLYTKMNRTLAEAVTIFSQLPLDFQPGTQWSYSNTGMATLGRIVEVVADQPYERFLDDRIFKPLGMTDSFFFPPENKKDRIASVYVMQNGALHNLGAGIYRKGAKYSMPEGGLYSTAADMAAFYQMMLNHGSYNGKHILSKASVDVMTMIHTGDLPIHGNTSIGWGLGWSVTKSAQSTLTLESKGTYSHGGAFGTYGWVDPAKDMVGVFMVQRFQGGAEPVRDTFLEIANSAVRE